MKSKTTLGSAKPSLKEKKEQPDVQVGERVEVSYPSYISAEAVFINSFLPFNECPSYNYISNSISILKRLFDKSRPEYQKIMWNKIR